MGEGNFNMANNIDNEANEVNDIVGSLPTGDVFRPITHNDLIFLLNMHPFVQVINPVGSFDGEIIPKIIELENGWRIIRYGNDAICSSPGEYVFSSGDNDAFMQSIAAGKGKKEDGSADSGDIGALTGTGKGTIVKQTHDTLIEILNMVVNSQWQGIELVDGTPLMKQMLWLLCEEKGLKLAGYDPDIEDKEKLERERRNKKRFAKLEELEIIRPH